MSKWIVTDPGMEGALRALALHTDKGEARASFDGQRLRIECPGSPPFSLDISHGDRVILRQLAYYVRAFGSTASLGPVDLLYLLAGTPHPSNTVTAP